MQQLGATSSSGDTDNHKTWRAFLEASRDQLVAQIQNPNPQPLDGATAHFGVSGLTTLRQLGHEFAEALDAWPEICAAAKDFAAD